MGGISKRGDAYLRTLLVHGAARSRAGGAELGVARRVDGAPA